MRAATTQAESRRRRGETTGTRWAGALGGCLALVSVMLSVPATGNAQPLPKTQFQCEKKYHTSKGRASCFDQLPGSSCRHPLEVKKTQPGYTGDTKYFNVELNEDDGFEEALLTYEWSPKKNVAICPYPIGAVFKVSLIYHQLPNGEWQGGREYDTKNIPEHTTAHGGSFQYTITNHPILSWFLVVKGYFIHPAWEH
jgi:hypothetical protein